MSGIFSAPSMTAKSVENVERVKPVVKPRCAGRMGLHLVFITAAVAAVVAVDSLEWSSAETAQFQFQSAATLLVILCARLVATTGVVQKINLQVDLRERVSALRQRALGGLDYGRAKAQTSFSAVQRLITSRIPQGPLSHQFVGTAVALVTLCSALMLLLPFLADMSGDAKETERMSFIDAGAPHPIILTFAMIFFAGIFSTDPVFSGLIAL